MRLIGRCFLWARKYSICTQLQKQWKPISTSCMGMNAYWGMKEVFRWEEMTRSNFLTAVNGQEHFEHKQGSSLAHTWILHKWRHWYLGVVSRHGTRRKPSSILWQHTNVPATIICHEGMDNREQIQDTRKEITDIPSTKLQSNHLTSIPATVFWPWMLPVSNKSAWK